MDNIYFKQLFRKFSGFVYEFVDQVPDGEDTTEYVVEQFVTATGKIGLEISLVRLPNNNLVIHSFENIEDEKFRRLCDLSYEPEPEPIVESNTDQPAEEEEE